MPKLKLAILISGRGSNMQALIKACQDEDFPAVIDVVISNRPGAKGLETAAAAGIHTEIIDHKNFESREAFEEELHRILGRYQPDLICLAGFMRILGARFISHWPEKIINIHPSLLPDYKGLHTHERAIADGKKEAGCTIHYVIPEMDAGPIILQKKVSIAEGDTPDSLAARVLEQEHIAYPEAVRLIGEDRVTVVDDKVKIRSE